MKRRKEKGCAGNTLHPPKRNGQICVGPNCAKGRWATVILRRCRQRRGVIAGAKRPPLHCLPLADGRSDDLNRKGFDRIYDLRSGKWCQKFDYAASVEETENFFAKNISPFTALRVRTL